MAAIRSDPAVQALLERERQKANEQLQQAKADMREFALAAERLTIRMRTAGVWQ
jgi:multidrug resistance efflux pump